METCPCTTTCTVLASTIPHMEARLIMYRILFTLTMLFSTPILHAAQNIHAPWTALLQRHVTVLPGGHATQVDYAGFSAERLQLRTYLNVLTNVNRSEYDRWSKKEQLAFLINAYNAWTVELVLSGYPRIESIKDLGTLLKSPWKKRFVTLFGTLFSLDDIEHTLIRGTGNFNEPRIHFAVNCAAQSCPPLWNHAYTAENLESSLEKRTRAFINNSNYNSLSSNSAQVSKIFDWYNADFGKLSDFLNKYAETPLNSDAEIRFNDYNWEINNLIID